MATDKKKPDLAPEGFAQIRNGIREHYRAGKLSLCDLGLYLFLHLECSWDTGIYHGTAEGICRALDGSTTKEQVKRYLRRLRDKGYINYREGDGKRRGYDILIHKFRPRLGKLSGTELNAWKHDDKVVPVYEPFTGEGSGAGTGQGSSEGTGAGSSPGTGPGSLFQKYPEVIPEVSRTKPEDPEVSKDAFASRDTFGETRETLDPISIIDRIVPILGSNESSSSVQETLSSILRDAETLHALDWFLGLNEEGDLHKAFPKMPSGKKKFPNSGFFVKNAAIILQQYRKDNPSTSRTFETED